jgi:hypothetical protein
MAVARAAETVAQIAAVMREEVVGTRGHDQSANMGVRRIASEARHVRDMWIEVDAPGGEAQAQVVDPSSRGLSTRAMSRETLSRDGPRRGPAGLHRLPDPC